MLLLTSLSEDPEHMCVLVHVCECMCTRVWGGTCNSSPIFALIPALARSLCSYLAQLLCISPHD